MGNEKQHKSLWSKSFIDLQNDVTTKDLTQTIREGFDRIEHLKRFTTNSMGTDQGKISSINALGLVAKLLKKSVSKLEQQHEPPYNPVSFSAIAGRSLMSFMILKEKLQFIRGIQNITRFLRMWDSGKGLGITKNMKMKHV